VNIVQWFGDNIFGDLQAAAGGGVHPALQVDAIRYLYTFRYQVRFKLFISTRVVICTFISRDSSRRNNWSRCCRFS
jgi:exportin-2 (importin alpha re-exporter)